MYFFDKKRKKLDAARIILLIKSHISEKNKTHVYNPARILYNDATETQTSLYFDTKSHSSGAHNLQQKPNLTQRDIRPF